ncbi:hypothetical protein ACIKT0_01940 [Hansschlegelia beijingensis]|uniref:hypothetical protein n=1 Tax=Hansschlegelia beijingensis TaxID=1133344 RepID=UPI00387F28D1
MPLALKRSVVRGVAAAAVLAAAPAFAGASPPEGLTIAVELSPKAQSRLAELGEGIVASAFYFGPPAKGAARRVSPSGQVEVPLDEIAVQPRGVTRIPAAPADARRWIAGEPRINVNLYTARRKSADNLLDCAPFEGAVPKAADWPVRMACKLIGED